MIDPDGREPIWTDTVSIRGQNHQVNFSIERGTGQEFRSVGRNIESSQTTDRAVLTISGPNAAAVEIRQYVSVTVAFLHADNTWSY